MLTPAQITTLKATIIADSNLTAQKQAHDTQGIADYLNADSTFVVWKTSMPTRDLYDAITWAALTPTDLPDGTLAWQCRSLACQGKQFNLQVMIGGLVTVYPAKANFRAGVQDALTAVPSGAGGATVSAGWVAVKTAMARPATRLEKIFASGTGTAATPGLLVLEDSVDELTIRRLAWSDTGDWLL